MAYLKEKSHLNLLAAEILIREKLYAPSVHCCYYSVFQLMKYIVKDFSEIDYNAQYRELSDYNQNEAFRNIGTHEYIILKVTNELRRYDSKIYVDLNRKIKDLKRFRLKSDYENIGISEPDGGKAFGLSVEINHKLKQIFNVK